MLLNCPACSKVYNKATTERFCKDCCQTYVKLFQFMNDHPEARFVTIEEHLGLNLLQVRTFLKHGKFIAFEDLSRQLFKCRRCGGTPDLGEMCRPCFESMVHEIIASEAGNEPETENVWAHAKDSPGSAEKEG